MSSKQPMGYFIRMFTTVPLGSLVPVHAQMMQRGFDVKPVGTNQLDITYAPDHDPITVDLNESEQDAMRRDVEALLAGVAELPPNPAQTRVLDMLARAEALVVIGVPDDPSFQQSDMLDDILDIVSNAAPGMFHIEGDGFYENGRCILELR